MTKSGVQTGWVAAVLAVVMGLSVAVPRAHAVTPASAEAAGVAKQAMDYYKASEFGMAAELYRRAFRINPTRPEYLFGLGRSLQNAKKFQEAMLAYESLLALLPSDDPWSKKGRTAVSELQKTMTALEKTTGPRPPMPEPEAKPTPPAPTPAPAEPVKVVVEIKHSQAEAPREPAPAPVPAPHAMPIATAPAPVEDASAGRTYAKWGLLGVGGAALITGVAVYAAAAADRAALDEKLAQTSGGYIAGVGYEEASAQAAAIGKQKTAGVVVLLVGAAAAVGGGVLWLTEPSARTAWLPMPTANGVQWAGRF